MDARDFYRKCLEQATAIVMQVQAGQLSNETPDDEWTVRDLANHMLYEVSWVPEMVQGKTMAQVGGKYDGDLFDGDVANANVNLTVEWEKAANLAEEAVNDADPEETAHMSFADAPNREYLLMTGSDILIHAWDLAKAIGVPMTFDEGVAQTLWARIQGQDMSSTGLFKAPLQPADDANTQAKIIAQFGRDVNWTPSA